jgi:hypothetical protein
VVFIVTFSVASAAYRLIYFTGFERSAALFIGVPAIVAIGLTYAPRSRSALGMVLKGSMLALLLAGIVFPEGLGCLLFAAPLVALVAIVVGAAIDVGRRWLQGNDHRLRVALALPLAILSMEGVVGDVSPVPDRASATRDVRVAASAIQPALAQPPTFVTDVPRFLRLGFNRPVHAHGAGLVIGDERIVEFAGGTHDDHPLRLFGVTGQRSVDHHSHQTLRVAAVSERRVVFDVVEDTTMTIRWARMQRAVVTWRPRSNGLTRVTWTFEYDRRIAPAFYFAPLERYAAGQAAGYLIDDLLAPVVAGP